MINLIRRNYRTSLNIITASGLLLSLSGCIAVLPPALQLASLALDGVSYVATGKSVTDHALSGLTSQDCAMIRVFKGQDMCSEKTVQVAQVSTGNTLNGDALDQSQIDAFGIKDEQPFNMETAQGPLQ
jgi:hypothetical protein